MTIYNKKVFIQGHSLCISIPFKEAIKQNIQIGDRIYVQYLKINDIKEELKKE